MAPIQALLGFVRHIDGDWNGDCFRGVDTLRAPLPVTKSLCAIFTEGIVNYVGLLQDDVDNIEYQQNRGIGRQEKFRMSSAVPRAKRIQRPKQFNGIHRRRIKKPLL